MGRNERCWCGSGKKWKRCHRLREEKEELNYFDGAATLKRKFAWKTCFHPSAPTGCGKIIAAHTLQRSGTLTKIAENGQVYSFKSGIKQLHKTDGKLLPVLIGIKKASVFNGFCEKHDDTLFQPIESGMLPINGETSLLITLRALAYELHTKSAALATTREMATVDSGQTFERQAFLQQMLSAATTGQELGIKDIEKWKSKADYAYINKDFYKYKMLIVEFSGNLPLSATGAFIPEHDFSGNLLHKLDEVDVDLTAISLSFSGENSVMVFAWHEDDSGRARKLAESFSALPDDQKATGAALLAFVYSENIYLTPSWWDGLDADTQSRIERLVAVGALGDRPADELLIDQCPFSIEVGVLRESWV